MILVRERAGILALAMTSSTRAWARASSLGFITVFLIACGGAGLSKDAAKPFVALSLSGNNELQVASFTGPFCESDDARRTRMQNGLAAAPSNAFAFARMANDRMMKTLIANGYVSLKEETLAPDEAEARHPACGKRDTCARCPVVSKYYVDTYDLTAKGKELFLATPATEDEYTRLYNAPAISGPFDDVQQEFSDDMPVRISVVAARKTFDVTAVTIDSGSSTARVSYEWYWTPAPNIEKTPLKDLVPKGRNKASLQLKQLDDGWHLARDADPVQ